MNTSARLRTACALLVLGVFGCSTSSTTGSATTSEQSAKPAAESSAAKPVPSSAAASEAIKEASSAVTKRSVYYDFDQFDIKPAQRGTVENNAAYLRAHPDLKVRIEGNADERGSREYNLALGQRRAEGVMKTMSLLGVSQSRMESVSYGMEHPKATGHDEQSWAENRRSDIIYP